MTSDIIGYRNRSKDIPRTAKKRRRMNPPYVVMGELKYTITGQQKYERVKKT